MGVNFIPVCVVHFCVYVSRGSHVELICLVRLGFSFSVSCLYICKYKVSMFIRFSINFQEILIVFESE